MCNHVTQGGQGQQDILGESHDRRKEALRAPHAVDQNGECDTDMETVCEAGKER